MTARDDFVEQVPNLLLLLGVGLILLDGPLPFGDVFGVALISYGSALRASYKVADAAIWIEAHLPSTSDSTPPPDLVHQVVASLPDRTSISRARSGLALRWCNRHRRHDTCHKY